MTAARPCLALAAIVWTTAVGLWWQEGPNRELAPLLRPVSVL